MTTKTETIQFQYEIQAYQENCVNNIISLFESLRQKETFSNTLTAHHQKYKYNFPVQETKNIDIMMETGTGIFLIIYFLFVPSSAVPRMKLFFFDSFSSSLSM